MLLYSFCFTQEIEPELTLERKKVMVIRKHGKKWQCLVRVTGVSITQSFWSKTDARLWGQKTEVDIVNGVYLKNLKLDSISTLPSR